MDQIISLQSLAASGNLFSWGNFVGSADASLLGITRALPKVIAVTSHLTGRTIQFFFNRLAALDFDGNNVAIYDAAADDKGLSLHVYNA